MTIKVFILGRPGSGKSAAAMRIAKLAQREDWTTTHINDYAILHNWFMEEMHHPKNNHTYFHPTEHGGFDVIDFSVLRLALEEVEKKVQKSFLCKTKLVLIEFARGDYSEVLKAFSNDVLHDAYFLFLESDLETCMQRIHRRTIHPHTGHDHYVSNDILSSYYHKDNKPYMLSQFAKDYHLDHKRIKVIDNVGSWDAFMRQIKEFSDTFLEQKRGSGQTHRSTDLLPKPAIGKRTGSPSGAFPSLGSPIGCGCNLNLTSL
jgi:adenylate kinase family enzyme